MTLRIISLGWGIQSWTLAAMAALGELEPVDYAIHADTTHEAEGTYAHAAKWTPWLEARGVTVATVKGNRLNVIERWKAETAGIMIPAFTLPHNPHSPPGQIQRQCTSEWKINAIRRFVRSKIPGSLQPGMVQSVLGISLDEWHRMRDSDVAYITNVYPLVDLRMSRADCVTWLEANGLDVPPKSACVFCPYKSMASWKALKRQGGADWEKAVEADAAIRDQRDTHTLFIHPARQPLPQAVSIPEDIGAKQLGFYEEEQPCDSGVCFT